MINIASGISIKCVDSFLEDTAFNAVKERAARAMYADVTIGRSTFRDIALDNPDAAYARMSEVMGRRVRPVLSYFRKYANGVPQDTFIHADGEIARYSAVLSLRDGNGEIAFWSPIDDGGTNGQEYWMEYGTDESKWTMLKALPLPENRCVIYEAALFHSRLPRLWTSETPRLVQALFFNLEEVAP